jgi:hypothetical protein
MAVEIQGEPGVSRDEWFAEVRYCSAQNSQVHQKEGVGLSGSETQGPEQSHGPV